ncbi:MAG: Nif3-like dinuclear metal center hexameric protein [Bacteroidota bacterium]
MITVQDITSMLESVAPPHLQESYDNSGLIVGRPEAAVTGILFCLDSTEEVIEEAVRRGCNMVVAHHPIVFRGLKRFNGSSYVERTVIRAIREDVAVYAIHTNLDNVYFRGVNSKIAEKLGLTDTAILLPRPGQEQAGAGLVGNLNTPMDETDFLYHVRNAMNAPCVRHTRLLGRSVRRVAVCGGAGSFLLSDAVRAGADAFVSADFKYHEFFDAEDKLIVADIGHFESEQYTIQLLFDIIREKYPTFALHLTEVRTNPVYYL